MEPHMIFADKTILVTGGGGGLGRSISEAFVNAGGQVVVADVDEVRGRATSDALGHAARFAALDVTDESQWTAVLDNVDAEMGGLDVLVNNAGYYAPNVAFEDMSLALWRKHFAINADGVFLGCKHGIRRMRERGGSIINMGSGMSITANPMASAYCGSKAAVLMTTRTAAASAGAHNIRVNAVLPGAVNTPMLMANLTDGVSESEYLEQMAGHSPLGRLATPQDIARAVLFLADPANAAISGTHLAVDGGNMPGS
jgi:NAD(P)-dependent dehydrogenase (short-subunit alcohol dehydrogenase family)